MALKKRLLKKYVWRRMVHRSFLSQILFRHGLKSQLEEISQKFNYLLKGTDSKQFLKAFGALSERPARNGIKMFKNGFFQKSNFLLEDRP